MSSPLIKSTFTPWAREPQSWAFQQHLVRSRVRFCSPARELWMPIPTRDASVLYVHRLLTQKKHSKVQEKMWHYTCWLLSANTRQRCCWNSVTIYCSYAQKSLTKAQANIEHWTWPIHIALCVLKTSSLASSMFAHCDSTVRAEEGGAAEQEKGLSWE